MNRINTSVNGPETTNSALDNDEDRYRFMGLLEDLDNTTQSNVQKPGSMQKHATAHAANVGVNVNHSRHSS